MKRFYCYLTFLFCYSYSAIGQVELPIFGGDNAYWTHCLAPDAFEPMHVTKIFHQQIDSFSVNGFFFSRVAGDFIISPSSWIAGVGAKEILFTSNNDKVYYVVGDELHLLYDFAAEVGDTMNLRFPVEIDPQWFVDHPSTSIYYKYIVAENTHVEIEGQMLRRQYILPVYDDMDTLVPVALGYHITEKFGFENFILPYIFDWATSDWNIACDLEVYGEDTWQYIDQEALCGVLNTSDRGALEFTLYPNPAADVLYITGTDMPESVSIYTPHGNLIRTIKERSEIRVDDLTNGIYLLKLTGTNYVYAAKFMKI
ncbi:MAG: T9SS type A sorting domain-containing protein [Bacteroidota bacterium]